MSINHSREAQINPEAYAGYVDTPSGTVSVLQAAINEDVPPVVKRFGYWVVCNDGNIYCLYSTYIIPKERFSETNWNKVISEKTWAEKNNDFNLALEFAKNYK